MPQPPSAEPEFLTNSSDAPAPPESEHDPEGPPPDKPATTPTALRREETEQQLARVRAWSHLAPPGKVSADLQRQADTELETLENNLRVLQEAAKRGPTPEEEEAQRHATEEVRRNLIEKLERWAAEDQPQQQPGGNGAPGADSGKQP